MQNLLTELKNLLQQDERFTVEGKLLKNTVIEFGLKLDPALLKLLLSQQNIKQHFFQEVDGVLVFDKIKFQRFVNNKAFLEDSYTSFKNKIGLITHNADGLYNEFISENKEVLLSWPYKDCVLEGGQTKEDAKRNEIFWNETLAPDQINRLLAPKALTNFKKYDKDGEHSVKDISLQDNLIIKGNNLLALHSLAKVYTGKIKLIYIDPPYNTRNDSFGYNDSYNHSTWLSFMRNRLEVSRELLSDYGSIYIQLDYNEVHYCKILMDEIFGSENFQREIIWRIGWVSGYKSADNNWVRNHDTILFYIKKHLSFNKQYIPYPEDYVRRDGKRPEGKGFPIEDTWNSSEHDSLNSIQLESFNTEKTGFITQKNEDLIQRIIEASSDIGDIVLDFCLGSGTTAAVCHKIGRRYIGVEQMDEQINVTQNRLKNVINGDTKGISKSVNWQGGGSFIYCELSSVNQKFADLILSAKTTKSLILIFKETQEKAFLSYKVEAKKINETAKEFAELSLEEQKKFMIELLDKNMLYVPYSEIEDTTFGIPKEVKELNHKFYNLR